MGCNNTTVYLSGAQVALCDLSRVWINGTLSTPAALATFSNKALVRIESRFGECELEFDGSKSHGRAGRTTPHVSNPVLAALALSNQLLHDVPNESLPHAKKVTRASLRSVSVSDLTTLLASHDASEKLRILGGPLFALLKARISRTNAAPFSITPHPEAEFERRAIQGAPGKPKSWTQAAVLARIDGRRFLNDSHPLVRASAMHGLNNTALNTALSNDPAALVRRNAAHVITSRLGVPLTATGRIASRSAEPKADVLFIDIDGTLCEGANNVDQESLHLLKEAQQRGLVVVAVTGRSADAFSMVGFDADLVCSSGVLWDPVTKHHLADVSDKAKAVSKVCELLGTSSVAAAGDGEVDVPMFKAVRAMNGACGWPVTGQPGPAALATDLLNGVGSGSLGRFALDLLEGSPRPTIPPVQPLKPARTNYAAQLISLSDLESVLDDSMLPQGWELAHGHVTLAYPQKGAPRSSLPLANPNASVHLLGRVITDEVTTFVVEVDGVSTQADGSPLHVTVGLGLDASNKRVAPVAGNKATSQALANGSVQWFDEPIPVRALPSSAGSHIARLDRAVEDAVLSSKAPEEPVRRAVAAGLKVGLVKAASSNDAAMHDPVSAAIASGDTLKSGLIVLSGIPASGKSTAARELADRHNAVIVSLDAIREEVNGSAGDQSNLPAVLAVAKARIETELALGRLVVSDATNVEARVLRELVQTAHRNDLPAVIARVDVTREVALSRDEQRHNRNERALGNSLPDHLPGDPWNEAHAAAVIDKMLTRQAAVSQALDKDRLGADALLDLSDLLS